MIAIRMREARFTDGAHAEIGPLTLDVPLGASVVRPCASSHEAAIVARMAAGLVKARSGSVSIGDYDPTVQPVHCKRLAAFIGHDPAHLEERDFERYIGYRAALCGIDPSAALAVAGELLERLAGVHPAFAFPIVGALIASPMVVVMDRPAIAFASHIHATVGARALFSTHVDHAAAAAFCTGGQILHSA